MNKIWITGASSGIGKSLALRFANEGWQVAASARRESLLNEISRSNKNIFSFPLDVTDSEKCKDVFNKIKEKFNEIDISVFCTGIHDPSSEKKFDLESIRKIMNVNFFGTINSVNAVYDYYREKKSGHISIVSSVAGYRGLPAGGAYCASKAALTNYAESLYFDMKRFNVRVSVIFALRVLTLVTSISPVVERSKSFNVEISLVYNMLLVSDKLLLLGSINQL